MRTVRSHAAGDRGDEHQDRDEVQHDEPPLSVRLNALAAQHAETGEEELHADGVDEISLMPR